MWTCYSYQPNWYNGESPGFARFGKGNKAKGYVIEADDDIDNAENKEITLKYATMLGQIGIAIIVTLGYIF